MWSVFFVFLSYLDGDLVKADVLNRAVDAEKENKELFSSLNGTFCAKMLTGAGNVLYQVSDGVEIVQSLVSPSGKLVNCSVLVNQMQVKSFMHECEFMLKVQKAARQLDARFAHMDEAKARCRKLNEKSERGGGVERDDSDDSEKVFKRSKRGFTYPGTLWCGAGNTADHYNQLGEFAETDSCCRIHDHCPHVIHAFSSKFGYTNFKWHSISHCDCDENLRACLRRVNDTSSRVVGQAFFNVIGVPCFDFAYEELCAERHWYGLCKRYERLPTAVIKNAIPYDYGGIDVIDKLPLPSSKKKDPKKEEKEENMSKTQSTTMPPGPEEPSLRNVVTAAEDFIKVLATVSTSQSSTASSDRGEAQSSEKKKRKKSGKKKKSSQKGKGRGKGRKSRKQKEEAGSRADEGTAASAPGGKGGVKGLGNFISESHGHDPARKRANGEREPVGKQEPLNDVMKDEPAADKDAASVTSPPATRKKPEAAAGGRRPNPLVPPKRAKTRRLDQRAREKAVPPPRELPAKATDVPVPAAGVPRPEQRGAAGDAPPVSPEVNRTGSKERGDREWRKKRRKDASAPPAVAAPTAPSESNPARHLIAAPPTEAPAAPPGGNGGRSIARGARPSASFSVLNTQKLKERGPRGSRRKAAQAAAGRKPPQDRGGLAPPTPPAADGEGETRDHAERLSPAAAAKGPSVPGARHRQATGGQRRPRKRTRPSDLVEGASAFNLTEQTPPPAAAAAAPLPPGEPDSRPPDEIAPSAAASPPLSPAQLSVEKLQAQFNRKKRRKMALRQP